MSFNGARYQCVMTHPLKYPNGGSLIGGYWSVNYGLDHLPCPLPCLQETGDETSIFVNKLKEVEFQTEKVTYLGYSYCRICREINGDSEFFYTDDTGKESWRWPEGITHYYTQHHVRPSEEFRSFIEKRYTDTNT